jgi:hypothetical protein
LGISLGIAVGAGTASGGTLGSESGGPTNEPADVTVPAPSGTSSTKGKRPGEPERKGITIRAAAISKRRASRQAIKIDVIEDVELQSLSRGRVIPLMLYGPNLQPKTSILLVTNVVKQGKYRTTVEFKSLMEEPEGIKTEKTYVVSHPYSTSEEKRLIGKYSPAFKGNVNLPKLVEEESLSITEEGWRAHQMELAWALVNYLENLANKLETGGRKIDAIEVRREVQRIRSLLQQQSSP